MNRLLMTFLAPAVVLALPVQAQNASVVQGLLGAGASGPGGISVGAGPGPLGLGSTIGPGGLSAPLSGVLNSANTARLSQVLGGALPAGSLPVDLAVPAGALDGAALESVLSSGLRSLPASSLPADFPVPVSSLGAINPRMLRLIVEDVIPAGSLPENFPVLVSGLRPADLLSVPAGLLPAATVIPLDRLDLAQLQALAQSGAALPGLPALP